MGKIIRDGIVYAGSANKANQISYDNTTSGLEANSVQAALDILESKVGDGGGISLTQAEYDALSPEEQMNGTYYIYDVDEVVTALDIGYDNTNSGLESDSVQNAINELDNNKAEKSFVITVFEQLKTLIEAGQTGDAVAVLDQAILDLSVLG